MFLQIVKILVSIILFIVVIEIVKYFIEMKRKIKNKKIELKKIQEADGKEVIYTLSQLEEIQREFNTNNYNHNQIDKILLLMNKKVPFELIKLVLDPYVDWFMMNRIAYNYDNLQLIGVKEILRQLKKGIYDSGDKFESKATIFIANKKLENLKNSNYIEK